MSSIISPFIPCAFFRIPVSTVNRSGRVKMGGFEKTRIVISREAINKAGIGRDFSLSANGFYRESMI